MIERITIYPSENYFGLDGKEVAEFFLPSKYCRNFDQVPVYEIRQNILFFSKRLSEVKRIFLILTGVSGGGKDALVEELLKRGNFARVKSCTTRQEVRPRDLVRGEDIYIRLSKEEFWAGVRENRFLEFASYDQFWVGTDRWIVSEIFRSGKIPILRLDPQGTLTIFKKWQKEKVFSQCLPLAIYILPESPWVWARRLCTRDLFSCSLDSDRKVVRQKIRERWQWTTGKDLHFIGTMPYLLVNQQGRLTASAETVKGLVNYWQDQIRE